jgi:four helix bundle protein
MNFLDYQKLDVWNESYGLTQMIYTETKNFPKNEQFGLTQQIRRASISIVSNIAEGCGRNHYRDKLQFFYISRGSLFEVEAQIAIARKLDFISVKQAEKIYRQSNKSKMLLNGFITYYKNKLS